MRKIFYQDTKQGLERLGKFLFLPVTLILEDWRNYRWNQEASGFWVDYLNRKPTHPWTWDIQRERWVCNRPSAMVRVFEQHLIGDIVASCNVPKSETFYTKTLGIPWDD